MTALPQRPAPMTPEERRQAAAERRVRDRLRVKWMDEHTIWDLQSGYNWTDEEFGARYIAWRWRKHGPICVYTTARMFDDRFWSMRFRWVKVRKQYELERTSVRQHARRKDAKARSLALRKD